MSEIISLNNCRDSGWHCLPSQVYFYMQQAIRVGQITLIVLSWTVLKLNVSLCESCFSMVHPNSESVALLRPKWKPGDLMPSGWIFLKYEAAESSVQPLILPSTRICKLSIFVTLTNQQLPQKEGGTNWGLLLCPTFPSRMLAQSHFSSSVL